ncbi:hypothetical protein RhiirA4_487941 [Rhizophagus irregularis]|uniref:Uncharacterized protein n=1 Tax=Rhizophagus irregularis TaxID=588596 RepID=A0A2I1HT98_9GLOM|nr:hypothetical protein RhiirA4_487941 [Rhizophagus irregularis]
MYKGVVSYFKYRDSIVNVDYKKDNFTEKKEANLQIRVLENTDHRKFSPSKKKVNANDKNESERFENIVEPDKANKTIS